MESDLPLEERIIPQYFKTNASPIIRDSLALFYGAVASVFRIPTFMRRCRENTSYMDRAFKSKSQGGRDIKESEKAIFIGAGLAGLTIAGTAVAYSLRELINEEFAPATIIAMTNLGSYVFEKIRKKD